MNVERRLQEHFESAAGRLGNPPERLGEVMRRGRRRRTVQRVTAACGVVAVAVAIPFAVAARDGERVEFDPIAPITEATPTPDPDADPTSDPTAEPQPSPEPTSEPGTRPTPAPDVGDPGTVRPGDLPAPVLTYGPAESAPLRRVAWDGEHTLWSGPVDAAFPDGRGGVVLQPTDRSAVIWLPGTEGDVDGDDGITLVEATGELQLRGLTPDGRVLYSVRPSGDAMSEGDTEDFYAVALEAGSAIEPLGSAGAYETWLVGPAAGDGGLVHAVCHLHCSLWPGLGTEALDGEPLYYGGGHAAGPTAAIEGLTGTPDGRVVAFVEFDPTHPDPDQATPPTLVLLDGTTLDTLSRVELPRLDGARQLSAVVSLSSDAHTVLAAIGPADASTVPSTAYVVTGALGSDPQVHPLESVAAARWAEPVATATLGGAVTGAERDAAGRFLAFSRSPASAELLDAVPFAGEVRLGLGPDYLEDPRPASALGEPGVWQLDVGGGDFRGLVGPFSALELLAASDGVVVSGGPHPHCASPPMPAPAELSSLRLVSLQPSEFETCLQWWTVHLYLDDSGTIAAVSLDLWGP